MKSSPAPLKTAANVSGAIDDDTNPAQRRIDVPKQLMYHNIMTMDKHHDVQGPGIIMLA